MSLERAELGLPLRLQLVEERLDRAERLWVQLEQPHAGVFGNPSIFDDPGGDKDLQMPAHRRLRHPGRVGQLAGPVRPHTEQVHHPTSCGVGQDLEYIHWSLIIARFVKNVTDISRASPPLRAQ